MKEKGALKKAISVHSRDFEDFRYVYPVISRRSGGVSLGINLNRDKKCNFQCVYCQVNRRQKRKKTRVYLDRVIRELEYFLERFSSSPVSNLEMFQSVDKRHKHLKDVALSGDGEPTCYPRFFEICSLLNKLQSSSLIPFKLVLITNGSRLGLKKVQKGLRVLSLGKSEIWVKLDAGSQTGFRMINRSSFDLNVIEQNIITASKLVPVKIQTLLLKFNNQPPDKRELDLYLERIMRSQEAGARISGIQLYTLARPPSDDLCKKVSRKFLEKTADKIRNAVNIPVFIY